MAHSEHLISDQDTDNQPHSGVAFPIVGVGASAGGLESFTELLSVLPKNTGMGFVLIQHLDPAHKSQLTQILTRAAVVPVQEAQEGMPIEQDRVYVLPSNAALTLDGGNLRLSARPTSPKLHLPIDQLFLSLAEAQGPLSIGIILSGTGSDGAQGVKAIKEQCGITFAQDEETARYSGMPRSAVATGAIDFVLPPAGIAAELARISAHPYVSADPPHAPAGALPHDDESLEKILALLRRGTQVNFHLYRQRAIRRRIGRRMIVRRCDTLREYLHYLQEHPGELRELYRDILIHVTSFFRDPPVFTALTAHLTAAIREKQKEDSFRVWVPGCATGEEIYSLAICLDEISREIGRRIKLQLFGTDISEPALTRARLGVYPETLANAVSPERLQRYFTRVGAGYHLQRFIRDACIFARQDVTSDPPFARLDLVSCRNVLIYLAPALHKTLLPIFHYSLNPGGLLLLGTSETAGADPTLFQTIDPKHRIYRRKPAPVSRNVLLPAFSKVAEPELERRSAAALNNIELLKKADQAVQARYAPDGVVISEDLQIVQFRGRTGFYLEPAPGEATHDLMRMARGDLKPALRRTVAAAGQSGAPAREEGVRIEYAGESREINLEVTPISGSSLRERYFLVIFEQRPPAEAESPGGSALPADSDPHDLVQQVARLKSDLGEAREYIHGITHEHETALEELRAANEEAASVNEELLNTNDELGTAKQELQTTNEELTTLNDELQNRNRELGQLYNDVENLLAAVRLPILIVDSNLRLRRFTPMAEQWLGLVPEDMGRPVADLRGRLVLPDLDKLVRKTIEALSVETLQTRDQNGLWWSLSIRPYRTADHRIEGAILTFVDIDSLKRSLEIMEQAKKYAEAVVETVRQPLVMLTPECRIEKANAAFYNMFQISREDAEGRSLHGLGGGGWDIPALRSMLRGLTDTPEHQEVEIEHRFPKIGMRTMCFTGRRIASPENNRQILLSIEDISERRRAERALVDSNEELKRFAHIIAHDLQEPLRTVGLYAQLLEKKHGGGGELVQHVTGGVGRMQAMISGLLAYSRVSTVDAGTAPQVSANDCLREALSNLQAIIQDTGAEVTSGELPAVRYYQQQLTQLFQNLIGNALKYRRDDPPRVCISVERRGAEWLFSIRDNGLGFAPEDAERIFRIFKRLHGLKYSGTGIGLAICQQIVERHGGRIWAESEIGTGSAFFFTVPV